MNLVKTTLLLAALTGGLVLVGGALGGRIGAAIALAVAVLMNAGSYWFSDKLVLARYRAVEVSPAEAPRLHAIVDRLVARMGIPKPRVHVLPSDSPNAFATGRNPSHAAIAATQGLLEMMDDEELEGVLAHELGHVVNRDILVSTVAATLAGAIMLLAQFGRFLPLFSGGRNGGRGGGNPLAFLFAMLLAPFAATLIQLAISRTREYGADDAGVEVTGNPEGLARALEKLGRASGRIPLDASPATAHLFIVRPASVLGGLQALFSTHPPIEDRVARLRAQAQRGRTAGALR